MQQFLLPLFSEIESHESPTQAGRPIQILHGGAEF